MAPRGNNIIAKPHYRKHYTYRIKTHFDAPQNKKKRQALRIKKAEINAPRPVCGLLRPFVHCQTSRHNRRIREGRGFSLVELKEAGISAKYAATIGISVDKRRKNKSVESIHRNFEKLKAYKSKLILLPKKSRLLKNKPAEQKKKRVLLRKKRQYIMEHIGASEGLFKGKVFMPVDSTKKEITVEYKDISDKERQFNVYRRCQEAKAQLRHENKRKAKITQEKK
ncbi:60S ribosomal protein L13 [Intoshia linei]|uniref:60S ribosomal protein L13 n=1 Tax=Intoshia linei TaxID=1819745 RepID=A0A177AZV4_9BILA|nr:60S ribosomal protein L13 [Intoshia linei]